MRPSTVYSQEVDNCLNDTFLDGPRVVNSVVGHLVSFHFTVFPCLGGFLCKHILRYVEGYFGVALY